MAVRPLIIIGLEGNLPQNLPKRAIHIEPNRALIAFGTRQRKENDLLNALEMALNLKKDDLKIFVCEKSMSVKNGQLDPSVKKHPLDEFTHPLQNNQIWVEPAIARTYESYYLFDTPTLNTFYLKKIRAKKKRLRGLTSYYSRMVGRAWELNELSEILDQSFEERGQIVSVIGEGGMGKTRLYVDFEKILERDEVIHFKSQFPLDNRMPYSAIRDLIRQLVDFQSTPFDLTDIQKRILHYFLHPGEVQSWIATLEIEDVRQNIFEVICALLNQIKDTRMIFILDDVHWADKESIDLLHQLTPTIPKRQHMWLLIHRPDFMPDFNKALFYHQIFLKPLDEKQMQEQINTIFPFKHIAPSVLSKIHRFSRGNPFFVEEFFRHAFETHLIEPGQEIVLELNLEHDMPINIRAMIQARLDKLPKNLFETLKWLCVLGVELRVDEAHALIEHVGFNAHEMMDRLTQEHYLVEISAFPENKVGFYHDIIFETLRKNNLSEKETKERQIVVGDVLQKLYGEEAIKHALHIAQYYLRSKVTKNAYTIIHEAANQAYNQYNYTEALMHFNALFAQKSARKLINYHHMLDTYLKINKTDNSEEVFTEWKKIILKSKNKAALLDLYNFQIRLYLLQNKSEKAFQICENAQAFIRDNAEEKHQQMTFWLHEVNCYNLEENKMPASFSKTLFILRKLNGITPNTHKSVLYRSLYQFSTNLKKNTILSLDFIKKGIEATPLDASPEIKINLLKAYAYRTTSRKCDYGRSVRIWESIIQEKEKHGLIGNLEDFHAEKVVNNFFLGKYDKVLEGFAHIQKISPPDSFGKSYSAQWSALTHLVLNDFSTSKKILFDHRHTSVKNRYLSSMKAYTLSMYHLLSGDLKRAIRTLSLLKRMYEKKTLHHYVNDIELLILTTQLQFSNDIETHSFKDIPLLLKRGRVDYGYNYWAYQIYDLVYQTYNKDHTGKFDEIQPQKCPNAFLKQRLYVEKIKYLWKKGWADEAEKLRDEYRDVRKEMSIFMPDAYQEGFLNHPTLGVPDLNKL
jgi:hypothetical protein